MNKAKEEIIEILKKETKLKEVSLEVPKDNTLGDYAFPCFQLSKEFKQNPIEIAMDLAKKIKLTGYIKEVREVGPYLNFFVNKQKMAESVIKSILKEKEKYGKGSGKEKVMIEYVSPNTNKSLHLGHVRNGLLGVALANILEFSGTEVVKTCLNNDKGTGMTEAMLGYKLFNDNKSPGKLKSDHFVAKCYVDFKKHEKEAPDMKEKVKEMLLKWEEGDKEVLDIWKKLTKWVYQGYKETYKKLDIEFDKEYFESEIYKEGKEIVEKGLKKGIFERDEGAVVAKLEEYKLPNKVLIKSDGTSLYMTQDLYLAKLKNKDFKVDKSIYVVASEQDNHFRQLFKILELLKFDFADKLFHLSYGLVNLPSGRMKSREGTVVDADDMIEEVVSLAKKEIKKRHKDLSDKEVDKRAEIIGMGALKFFFLKFDNITSFTYDPEESLSFEGETGPYVQYAHARICSILRKHGKKVGEKIKSKVLSTKEDEKIILLLSKFSERVEEAASGYKPHIISRYLLDLSQTFNEFYHACPVLDADEETQTARLNLILAVKQILVNGLSLLGIEAPEAM